MINKTTEKETVTKEGGFFTIMAKPGDSLMFASIEFKGKTVGLDSTFFKNEVPVIKLDVMVNQLDEVMVVQYKDINAYSLGILTKKAKSYTPAERKVYTATSTSIDKILNKISGRTTMLKKEVNVEKKEALFRKIEYLFDENYYTERLKIPVDDIKGFQLYCVDDADFAVSLNTKNKTMSMFLITGLAQEYLKIIENEK